LVLCAPPVVLLGVVSPFAIRLAVSSIATAGAVAGRLYALSTAGSLLRTFLPALVLIPGIGTQRTLLALAALLAASARSLLRRLPPRTVPSGAGPDPRHRDPANVPRDRRPPRRVVVLSARRPLPRRLGSVRRPAARPAGRDQGRGGTHPRGGGPLPRP